MAPTTAADCRCGWGVTSCWEPHICLSVLGLCPKRRKESFILWQLGDKRCVGGPHQPQCFGEGQTGCGGLVRGPRAGQVPAGCSFLGPFCPRFWPPAPSPDSSDSWWPLLDRVGFRSGRWGYIYPGGPLRGCMAKGWWAGPLQRGLALQQGMCPQVGWMLCAGPAVGGAKQGWDTWPVLSSQWGSGSQVLPKPGVPTTRRPSEKFTSVHWNVTL